MRRFVSLLILFFIALPALAQEAPNPALAQHAPAHARKPSSQPRVTWQQRFAQANLAHDGHLTLAESQGGYPLIAKHFDDIDVDHKGYVSEDDIRAWRVMRKAAHRLAKPPVDRLKPQHAFQPRPPASRKVSTQQRVALPAGSRSVAAAVSGRP